MTHLSRRHTAPLDPAIFQSQTFVSSDGLPGARAFPFAPVRWLASHHFDAAAKANAVSVPVVTVVGVRDNYLPLMDARVLFEKYHGPKLMIETAGGHDHSGFIHVAQLSKALAQFWPPTTSQVAKDK
jgi:hypothetical protein